MGPGVRSNPRIDPYHKQAGGSAPPAHLRGCCLVLGFKLVAVFAGADVSASPIAVPSGAGAGIPLGVDAVATLFAVGHLIHLPVDFMALERIMICTVNVSH